MMARPPVSHTPAGPFEIEPTWWAIKTLIGLGLAGGMRPVPARAATDTSATDATA